ncbi:MAG: hypothetical protein DRR42_11170 [Gammaproteobacteria bacterium]|nr:MAG: hypothetical protein DRR42_11170 [Gammaproteobacteria bacterium]
MGRKQKTLTESFTYTAFVPNDDGKLERVGETKSFRNKPGFSFTVDDNPRARQLAYEHMDRLIFLKN